MKHRSLCLLASAVVLAWSCLGDSDGALIRAVRRDDAERVKRLLDGGADANAADGKGRTALARAVQRGNKEIVELLLAHGARVGRE
jgi:ankyrin repeat protein